MEVGEVWSCCNGY